MTNSSTPSSDDSSDLPRLPDLPSLPDLPIPEAQSPKEASEPEQSFEIEDITPPSQTASNNETQAASASSPDTSASPSSPPAAPTSQSYSAEQIPTGPPPIIHSDSRFSAAKSRQVSAWEQKHLSSVRSKLQTVGVLQMLAGVIGLLTTLSILISDYSSPEHSVDFFSVCWTIFIAMIHVGMILGGSTMYRMTNRPLCIGGACCAVLPCSCCFFLTIPMGIIALVILNQSHVKHYFFINKHRQGN